MLRATVLMGISMSLGCSEATTTTVNAADVYQTACARCHGTRGTGGLPASEEAPPPRDFTEPAWQSSRTDEELRAIVSRGKGSMPSFGDALSAPEIEAAIRHVRSFESRSTETGESF